MTLSGTNRSLRTGVNQVGGTRDFHGPNVRTRWYGPENTRIHTSPELLEVRSESRRMLMVKKREVGIIVLNNFRS